MRLLPISVPAGWDGEKDCTHFEERWEPVPSYATALWEWMRYHYGEYVQTLDAASRYFRQKDATLVDVDLRCMTPLEKIAALLEIAKGSRQVAPYRSRLLEDLSDCQLAETERERVVKEYRLAGDHAWMYPVIEAVDYLGTAAFLLEETMACENEDYHRFK